MSTSTPFLIKGGTTRINLTTTANTVPILADGPCSQVRLHNGTAAEVFVRLSTSAGNDAVIPVAGTPSYGMVMHNNTTWIVTVPGEVDTTPQVWISGIVAAGTGILYVTPGEGL